MAEFAKAAEDHRINRLKSNLLSDVLLGIKEALSIAGGDPHIEELIVKELQYPGYFSLLTEDDINLLEQFLKEHKYVQKQVTNVMISFTPTFMLKLPEVLSTIEKNIDIGKKLERMSDDPAAEHALLNSKNSKEKIFTTIWQQPSSDVVNLILSRLNLFKSNIKREIGYNAELIRNSVSELLKMQERAEKEVRNILNNSKYAKFMKDNLTYMFGPDEYTEIITSKLDAIFSTIQDTFIKDINAPVSLLGPFTFRIKDWLRSKNYYSKELIPWENETLSDPAFLKAFQELSPIAENRLLEFTTQMQSFVDERLNKTEKTLYVDSAKIQKKMSELEHEIINFDVELDDIKKDPQKIESALENLEPVWTDFKQEALTQKKKLCFLLMDLNES